MWPLVATGARVINTDPNHGRTKDPDLVLSNSQHQEVTMAPSGSPDKLHASARPSVATGATGINTGLLSCFRASDQDLAPGYCLGPDITLHSSG